MGAEGVDEVLTVSAPYEHFEAHAWQRALEALIDAERPALVLLGHTIDSIGFAPAVAARRGLGFASAVRAAARTATSCRRSSSSPARAARC
jgi:electron transfer flavoprotein alpha subunit